MISTCTKLFLLVAVSFFLGVFVQSFSSAKRQGIEGEIHIAKVINGVYTEIYRGSDVTGYQRGSNIWTELRPCGQFDFVKESNVWTLDYLSQPIKLGKPWYDGPGISATNYGTGRTMSTGRGTRQIRTVSDSK